MILAPLSANLLQAGTILTSSLAWTNGLPASYVFTERMEQYGEWRGRWVVAASTADKIDGNDGSAFSATLTPGTYYSWQEWAVMVAARLNAVSTNWRLYLQQGTAGTALWVLKRTSGTATLDPTATRSALPSMGFRLQARAAAASHTGDFAAVHTSESLLVDLGSAKAGHAGFLANPRFSPGVHVEIGVGSTTAASDATYRFADAADTEARGVFPLASAIVAGRYVELRVYDRLRDDGGRAGLGYWFWGPVVDTDRLESASRLDFESPSYSHSFDGRTEIAKTLGGQPLPLSEVAPGEFFSVAFANAPGLDASDWPELELALAGLGTNRNAFLAINPQGEPNRETAAVRLAAIPDVRKEAYCDRHGRWNVPLRFEKLAYL